MDRTRQTSISENLLVSVSIDLLYDGMVVQDDIFDSSGDRKLTNSGTILDNQQIDRIKRLNSGSNTIYVTGRTHKAMMLRIPNNVDIKVRHEVENSAGYSIIIDEISKHLEDIASKKASDTVSHIDRLNDMAEQLYTLPEEVLIYLINAVAPADEYLQRHSINVGILNGLAGKWMGMSELDISRLVLIGLLHDIGNIVIPEKIPLAPRKLTAVEYEVIKTHVNYTYDLLSEFPEDIRIAACSHHERLDGTGYNYKLKNDDIILNARITAVSDTYDAVVSQRAYQKPKSPFNALALLEKLSKKELDRKVVRAFIENLPKTLVGKPVIMSDGSIGVVSEYDLDDIGYPLVELSGRIIKTNENFFCESMFSDD